jgi:hypothetical protein
MVHDPGVIIPMQQGTMIILRNPILSGRPQI